LLIMTRTRYFTQLRKPKSRFNWVGSPFSSPSRPSHMPSYKAFNLDDLQVNTGEFILIRTTDSMNNDELDCEVAQLDKLYEDYDNKNDPYRAKVKWLCRPENLPANVDDKPEESGLGGILPLDNRFEVLGEARGYDEDISAETIYSKCTVKEVEVTEDPVHFGSRNKKSKFPCYMKRFNLVKRGKKYTLVPVNSPNKSRVQRLRSKSVSPVSPKVTPLRINVSKNSVIKNIKLGLVDCSYEKEPQTPPPTAETSDRSRRTPKPRQSMDYTELTVSMHERIKTRHRSSPGRVTNNVISTQRFTQVETATGSGRKLRIKCGSKTEDVNQQPSTKKVLDMLELEDESDDEIKAKKEPPILRRTRRASVSCTTPTRMVISTVTPRKPLGKNSSKKGAKSKASSSSDDDFTPKSRIRSSSDDEEVEPVMKMQNPKSAKKTYKRKFTPQVPSRPMPLPENVDAITEAQQRLHVSAVPMSLPCREDEFSEIYGYIVGKMEEGVGGCCYISGVPGTGKTATVMEVIRYLKDNKEDYPDFNFYSMNAMRLTSPEQAYANMWLQISKEKATPEHAMQLLDKRFSTAAPKRVTTIFLVDELDMLCTKKQDVLYNLFNWPSKNEAKLIILTIANTMDLPERVMVNRVSSRLGLTRQTFQPYNHTQLQTIVASRLDGLDVFHKDAIQLVARKVAGLSGDARRALDICRRATEMAESEGKQLVGMLHVNNAYQEMFSSPKIVAIRSCSKYEQLLLKVMVSEFYRTGVEETTVNALFRELMICLRTEGLEILSLPGTYALIARLSAARIVLSEHMKNGLETKIKLNVATEDINFALKNTATEEEKTE